MVGAFGLPEAHGHSARSIPPPLAGEGGAPSWARRVGVPPRKANPTRPPAAATLPLQGRDGVRGARCGHLSRLPVRQP
jgi:hypothetical protein